MSATELDLPVLASPDQIRRREFVTARRGYDPQQVRDYLAKLAEQVERMQAMLREARMDADAAANRSEADTRPDAYQRLAARFADTLRVADEQAAKIREEAERDAAKALEEARGEADRMRADAHGRAEKLRAEAETALREAKAETASAILSLTTRRKALADELEMMRSRLLAAAEELGSVLEPQSEAPAAPTSTLAGPAEPAPVEAPQSLEPESEAGDESAIEEPGSVEIRYEDLWEGTEPLPLDLPEIPPLDLNWDDLEEE
jgi:DivIVA domain-containing protein